MVKVIVTQYGARRRYLIPQILHRNNMLEYLYTDSCKYSKLGKLAAYLDLRGLKVASLNRLQRRQPLLPLGKIKTSDMLQIKLFIQKLFNSEKSKSIYTVFEGNSSTFKRWGCAKADWLYAMYIETFEFTRYAKEHGLKILADIYEDPYIFKELADEVQKIEEYHSVAYMENDFMAHYNLRLEYIDKLLEIADQYLVPSAYVAHSLKINSKSYDEKKVNIIPYVSSVKNNNYDNKPIRGRIIWIGNDPVRKGLVYALRAIKKLKGVFPEIDFRVIGLIPPEIQRSPSWEDLNFIGYCNKEQLKEEFRLADMCVFPTLAEGFAGSLLEAASFGVPIITTHASGFGEDFPGIFVERKSVDDIIRAVTFLLENRIEREEISHKIFDYSHIYNEHSFEKLLIDLLRGK